MLPSRVGVRNVEKVTSIGERLYLARVDCFIELAPDRRGVHPPRFEDVINEAIGRVMLGPGAARVEEIAQRIAVEVRERQDAWRVEVRIAARYPEHKPAPASGSRRRRSTRCSARRSPPSAACAGSWASPRKG